LYRALYRKWRPRTFSDVIGQDVIVKALQNQVASDKLGHAYLFTGTRGTGKTTCARILAKAINCPNCRDGNPCGECAVCTGVEDGSMLDVVEIDAASNNGVDDVRSLREEAIYTPTMGRYKVYIIDEVHMLSTAAFNALLKIVEEPPAHLVFILATTEVHKVPVTVLSRCQRYDFMRIPPQAIADRLLHVAGQENIELDGDAALLLGQLADGAMRDALSLLDTCSGTGEKVDVATVRRVAGVTDKSYLFSISSAVQMADVSGLMTALSDPSTRALDTRRLCEELILHYRNLMLGAVAQDESLFTQVTEAERRRYLEEGKNIPIMTSARAVRRLGDALEHIMRGGNSAIELELALLGIAGIGGVTESVEQSATPVFSTRKENTARLKGTATGQEQNKKDAPPLKSVELQRTDAATAEELMADSHTEAPDTITPVEWWPRLVERIGKGDMALFSMLSTAKAFRLGGRVLIKGNTLLFEYLRDHEQARLAIKEAVIALSGENLGIGPLNEETVAATQPDALDILRAQGVEVEEIS